MTNWSLFNKCMAAYEAAEVNNVKQPRLAIPYNYLEAMSEKEYDAVVAAFGEPYVFMAKTPEGVLIDSDPFAYSSHAANAVAVEMMGQFMNGQGFVHKMESLLEFAREIIICYGPNGKLKSPPITLADVLYGVPDSE